MAFSISALIGHTGLPVSPPPPFEAFVAICFIIGAVFSLWQ